MSFKRAKVAVYQGTTPIKVRKYAVHGGYAQPTLVWQMPRKFDLTKDYRVVVTGIRKAGSKKSIRAEYTVRLFAPTP